jgi:hypothetical protein
VIGKAAGAKNIKEGFEEWAEALVPYPGRRGQKIKQVL